MNKNEIENIILSTLDSLDIPGASLAIQYKRTSVRPMDSTLTWKSIEDATRYARNTDAEPYVPYDGQIISVKGEKDIYVLVEDNTISNADGRGHFKLHTISTQEEAKAKYLSKIAEDTAQKLIHFKEGIDVVGVLTAEIAKLSDTISSKDYVEKLLGWLITSSGDIDAKSLRLRDFLEVPELRYNRISIVSGEEWNAPGGGIIESVDEANQLIHLKLEAGEAANAVLDDICKGVFNNATGFQTSYFRITEKVDESTIKYILRSGHTFHPCKAMHFVAYGNFTDKDRQRSSYSTQSYSRYLTGVNGWEITKDMIAMQLGDLSNLKLFGIDMTGHSAYLRNIYMTGTIKQLSNDNVTEVPIPAFKGVWVTGKYWYYDEVTHSGSTWICIAETTTQEPGDTSTEWLKYASKGETGEKGNDGDKGEQGEKGEDGTSVQSVDVLYYLSTSPITLTGGTWVTISPTWVDGKYIWSKTKVIYSNGSVKESNPACITGGTGSPGSAGKGISSIIEQYYLSTSFSFQTGGAWINTVPSWVDGKYIWTRSTVTYTDNTTTTTNPVCVTGGTGATGGVGPQGAIGHIGTQGIPGTSQFFHVKYSANANGNPMVDAPSTYIGTAVTTSPIAPTAYTSYKWVQLKGTQGEKGDQGIAGPVGSNGQTSYLHIKYSDNGTSFTANNGETSGAYIGQYVDFTQADSSTFSAYTWTRVKGDKGDKGDQGAQGIQGTQGVQGSKGTDGVSQYFHVRYSANANGSPMSATPNTYIGTTVTFSPTAPTNYTAYTWAQFKGSQGAQGNQGIPGINGANGASSYLHIKYSDNGTSFTANNGETPGQWIGQYVDGNQADSNNFSVYTWTKVKGDKGDTGSNGVGIQSTDVMYYLSLSSSSLSGGSWSTTAPTWVNGRYMWSKTKVVYTNGTFNESDPVCITGGKGNDGSNGSNGKGIVSIVEQYYSSTSSMTQTSGSWTTTVPTWTDGKYIWTRSVITYTDGTSSTTSPVCVTGGKGETGVTGLPGALLRPRGEWKASTAYINNTQFRDTIIYNGNTYSCKADHTSGGSFDTSKWTLFNEFINVATQLLIAQSATIDVLGTSGIFVGDLAKTKGWLLSEGAIKHNVSGVELTADGKLSLPESGAMMVGNRTFIESGKIKVDFIDVDNLKVKNLDGATGSFNKLTCKENASCSIGFNSDERKMYFEGDMQHQGFDYTNNRSYRFLTSDLWCRGEFGHRKMTTLELSLSYTDNVYFHLYAYGTDTSFHKYSQPGKPVDCIVLKGDGNYHVRIMDSATHKMIVVLNESEVDKRVVCNSSNIVLVTIRPWRYYIFITGPAKYNQAVYAFTHDLFLHSGL